MSTTAAVRAELQATMDSLRGGGNIDEKAYKEMQAALKTITEKMEQADLARKRAAKTVMEGDSKHKLFVKNTCPIGMRSVGEDALAQFVKRGLTMQQLPKMWVSMVNDRGETVARQCVPVDTKLDNTADLSTTMTSEQMLTALAEMASRQGNLFAKGAVTLELQCDADTADKCDTAEGCMWDGATCISKEVELQILEEVRAKNAKEIQEMEAKRAANARSIKQETIDSAKAQNQALEWEIAQKKAVVDAAKQKAAAAKKKAAAAKKKAAAPKSTPASGKK